MPNNPTLQTDPTFLPVVNETGKQQAARIFNYLSENLETDPNKKIALIYAANNQQAEMLHKAYQTPPKIPEQLPSISGGGQAILFSELIKLINRKNIETPGFSARIRVLPIATSLRGGANTYGNIVTGAMMKRDLDAIQQHLQTGYDVRGIPRETGAFAIGGGSSQDWLTTKYATVTYAGQQQPVSQDQYVQDQLNALKGNIDANIATPILSITPTPIIPVVQTPVLAQAGLPLVNARPLEQDNLRLQTGGYHYAIKSPDGGRAHWFRATYKGSKQEFANLEGDFLKTRILCFFKEQLDECENTEALATKVTELKQSHEYAVLEKGQDIITRFFRLDTDSIKAFKKMIKDATTRVATNSPDNPPTP